MGFNSRLESCVKIYDRLAKIVLNLSETATLIIFNVHMPINPTTLSDCNKTIKYYNALLNELNSLPHSTIPILCGDFNAKLGTYSQGSKYMGHYGCGKRNKNGHHLANLLGDKKLLATNTYMANKKKV